MDYIETKPASEVMSLETLVKTYQETHKSEKVLNPRQQGGLQALINYLEGRGAEVGQLKTALQYGDSAAIKAWFEASCREHSAKILRNTMQQQGLRTLISHPGQEMQVVHRIKVLPKGDGIACEVQEGESPLERRWVP
jgi:hypothetical protein